MKHFITAVICGILFSAAPAFAGEGHSHDPITKEKAIQLAEKRLGQMATTGKVDKSWGDKKAATAEKKLYSGKEEWVIAFNNPGLADKSQQTLYMFFKIDGHYLATNYTGK